MSAPQFTPGPWDVRAGGQYLGIWAAYGPQVARCHHSSAAPERKANANLIAAAPELYETLSNLCAQAGQAHQAETGLEDWSALESAIVDANAALAKARGESGQ